MHIDIFTAVMFNVTSSFFMGLSLFFCFRNEHFSEIKGVHRWLAGVACECFGWFGYVLAKEFPDFKILMPLGSSVLLLSGAFYFHALVKFKEVNVSTKPAYSIFFIASLFLFYFDLVSYNFNGRVINTAFSAFLLMGGTSYLLLSKRFSSNQDIPNSHKIMGYIFAFGAFLFLFRGIYFLEFPWLNVLTRNMMQDGTFLALHVIIDITSCGFLLMCNDKYASIQKQTRLDLLASENQFKDLFENAPLPYQSLDIDGNFLHVNQAWKDLMDCGCDDEIVGKFFGDFLSEQSKLLVRKTFEQFNAQGHVESPIFNLNGCETGNRLLVNIYGRVARDTEGRFLRSHCILRDVTEQRQAEEALRASEARFKAIIELSPIPIGITNQKQEITFLNESFINTFGYDLNDIPFLSNWWEKAYPEKSYREWVIKSWDEIIEKVQKTHCHATPLEVLVTCKNGLKKTILASTSPLLGLEDDAYLAVMYDISKQKETEEMLQQLISKERHRRLEQSQFMAMLGHELKTPLAVIKMTLGMENAGNDMLLHANRAVNDITNLVERCLYSEKITDNQMTVRLNNCDVLSALRELKGSTQHPERFELQATSDVSMIQTDLQFFNIILFNLMDNALKYSAPNSMIEVSVQLENEGLAITVKNLVGIAGFPDTEKAFKKYYRNKAAHHQTGSGLGLYLVKTMANLLLGDVTCSHDNTSVIFKLWLPSPDIPIY